MGPGNLRRSVQDDFLQVLGDGSLRGDRLMDAISLLASRGAQKPFSTALGRIFTLDWDETEARDTLAAIERHRAGLEALLGRDPGFAVSAFDFLHEMKGTPRDPVFREYLGSAAEPDTLAEAREVERFEEAVRVEFRRAVRSGSPLALLRLSPEHKDGFRPGPPTGALAALRDGLRDVDVAAPAPDDGFQVLLPSTGREEALRAAERLRRYLLGATGVPYYVGVAIVDGLGERVDLIRQAGKAVLEARRAEGGVAHYRPDRRAHGRIAFESGLAGKVRCAGMESEILVEDLSLGGAMLGVQAPLPADGEVMLALRGLGPRPQGILLPSRVVRVIEDPAAGRTPFRAAVHFRPEARLRVAALLAGWPGTERRR